MSNYETLAFSAMTVFAALNFIDWFVYIIRPAPKASYFSKLSHRVAFLFAVALVYWYVNGMKFI